MQEIWQEQLQGESSNQQQVAALSLADRALNYGDGLFVTMRSRRGRICYLNTHLQRLQDGALRLGFHWQPSSAFLRRLQLLAQAHPNHCLKVLLSRGQGGRGYMPPAEPEPILILSVHQLPSAYNQWQTDGIGLAISPIALSPQPYLAGMKHLNRLEQTLIKAQALPHGIDEWLVLDQDKQVIGVGAGNLFLINNGQILTPKHSYCGIAGVMRQQLILTLLEMDYSIRATEISLMDLQQAEHLWISNSLMGAVPITHLECSATKQSWQWSIWSELAQLQQQELIRSLKE